MSPRIGLNTQTILEAAALLADQEGIHAVRDAEKGEAVCDMAKAYVAFAKNRPGLYDATLLKPAGEDKRIEEAGERIVNLALSVLKDYQLDDVSAVHAVRGLRSIMHGFATLMQIRAFGLPYDIEDSLKMTVRAFLAGLDARQTK